MKKKKIFIACDTTDIAKIKKIVRETNYSSSSLEIGYKFGLEFFNSKSGRSFISKIKNKVIWLDLKLKDIPNTISSTIYALKDLRNVRYLTVHASGGLEMMRIAKIAAKKTNKKLKILGVTVLTSFSNSSLKETGHTKNIKEIVRMQALLAKKAGLDGIICSGHEAKMIKKICRKIEVITPGIRLLGQNIQDQKRVITPNSAYQNGATGIVIGRSITNGNIKNNIKKLINSLN